MYGSPMAGGPRSGLPLLANDPHLRLQMPGQWYFAQLTSPGLAVIGATLPGLPFVVLGHNQDIAWGFTNTGSDTQDLFVERVDPADPSRYLTPDGSALFESRSEAIIVRDAAPVTLDVRATRHGPVLSDLVPAAADVAGNGHVLALAWTQLGRHRHHARRRVRDRPGARLAVTSWRPPSSTRAPSRTWPSRAGRVASA